MTPRKNIKIGVLMTKKYLSGDRNKCNMKALTQINSTLELTLYKIRQ